jgi:hypothetical protein
MILDRSHERPLMWIGCWSSNNPRPRSRRRCHLMLLSWTWMRCWPTNNRRYRLRRRCYIVVSCWTMMMFCEKCCLSKWIIYILFMIGKEKILCKWKCHRLMEKNEKFEDTKVVIRSRKTKKSNNTLAEWKRTNNGLQNWRSRNMHPTENRWWAHVLWKG